MLCLVPVALALHADVQYAVLPDGQSLVRASEQHAKPPKQDGLVRRGPDEAAALAELDPAQSEAPCPPQPGGRAALAELLDFFAGGMYPESTDVKARALALQAKLGECDPLVLCDEFVAAMGAGCAGPALANVLTEAAAATSDRLSAGAWPDGAQPLNARLRAAAQELEAGAAVADALAPVLTALRAGQRCLRDRVDLRMAVRPLTQAAKRLRTSSTGDASSDSSESSAASDGSFGAADSEEAADTAGLVQLLQARRGSHGSLLDQSQATLDQVYNEKDSCLGRGDGGEGTSAKKSKPPYQCYQFEAATRRAEALSARSTGWVKYEINCKREALCWKREKDRFYCTNGCSRSRIYCPFDHKNMVGGGYDPKQNKCKSDAARRGYRSYAKGCYHNKDKSTSRDTLCKCKGHVSSHISY